MRDRSGRKKVDTRKREDKEEERKRERERGNRIGSERI